MISVPPFLESRLPRVPQRKQTSRHLPQMLAVRPHGIAATQEVVEATCRGGERCETWHQGWHQPLPKIALFKHCSFGCIFPALDFKTHQTVDCLLYFRQSVMTLCNAIAALFGTISCLIYQAWEFCCVESAD